MKRKLLGRTGLEIPEIAFGSAILGNLFQVLPDTTKLAILKAIFEHIPKPVVIDTAGKYGAGLALEVIGNCLRHLGISDSDVIISNKLGWVRKPLMTPEPTFESGVWFGLEHDAEQAISYDGILRCWEEGLELLGGNYSTDMVSVHDPDEYLGAADSESDRKKRMDDILGAYQALDELRAKGYVKAIGVGAKKWKVIEEISNLANSYTLYSHPIDLLKFMDTLHQKQIGIINAAVFDPLSEYAPF